jgi:hypothetical protein
MKAKSIKGGSIRDLVRSYQESVSDGFEPTLAIVFTSIKQDRTAICKLFEEFDIQVFGATTGGEFIDEDYSEGGIVVMLLDIKRDAFHCELAELDGQSDFKKAVEIGEIGKQKFKNPAFLIATSHLESEPEIVLRGIQTSVGEGVNVFGGMAGDDFTLSQQFVFNNEKSIDRGVMALILDEDKIKIESLVTCGWRSAGTEKTITKSEGPWVYTIEDKPATDLISKFIGFTRQDLSNPQEIVIEMAVNCPMQLQREKGSPIMRGVFMADWETGAVMCAGAMPEGAKFRFSLPPDFGVIDKVIEELNAVKINQMPEADAVLVFSCLGRKITFGPMITKEIEGIKEVWGTPMAGFFSNGELGRAPGGNLELHGSTVVCVALKEK